MEKKECFKCDDKIVGAYQVVPLEKPYTNIFFCRSCFGSPAIDNPPEELLNQAYHYIENNLDKLSEYRKRLGY